MVSRLCYRGFTGIKPLGTNIGDPDVIPYQKTITLQQPPSHQKLNLWLVRRPVKFTTSTRPGNHSLTKLHRIRSLIQLHRILSFIQLHKIVKECQLNPALQDLQLRYSASSSFTGYRYSASSSFTGYFSFIQLHRILTFSFIQLHRILSWPLSSH